MFHSYVFLNLGIIVESQYTTDIIFTDFPLDFLAK